MATLKTDLYDESQTGGLFPWMSRHSKEVWGIDLLSEVAKRAQLNCPGLRAETADVRHLPFQDGFFDLVISNSTLDHFHRPEDLRQSLTELRRVLRPGGVLLVTLDNPRNPAVLLRNWLPAWRPLRRWGAVPYVTGHTISKDQLEAELQSLGLQIQHSDYIMHVPRLAAVHFCTWLEGASGFLRRAYVRLLLGFELLRGSRTGYFVAVVAVLKKERV